MNRSNLPLYLQLQEVLKDEIQNGHLKPGDQLPPERELSDQFQMSRMTVRQALNQLVAEGLLHRIQGKGTFVARPKIAQNLGLLSSFTEDMMSRGMKPGARVIEKEIIHADHKLAEIFSLTDDMRLIKIRRLRTADDEPIALETTHLPYERFADIAKKDLSGSLYDLLRNEYQVVLSKARQSIEAGEATPLEAGLLKIPEKVPVLIIERMSVDPQMQVIEYVNSCYRADKYKFYVELQG